MCLKIQITWDQILSYSMVVLYIKSGRNRVGPGKNSKKAEFGIIR